MNYIMLYYTQLFINKLFNYNKNFIISYIFSDLDNHNNVSNYLFKIIINK